ncbi:hypothetical protein, partial [Mycobacteroides abscessus]|uniref:hypothetical protein n=1 Tax=Mycobacteroides abscessus TaxID=36809 RepID=UPI001A977A7E
MLLCFVDESFKADFYGFGAVLADAEQTRTLTAHVHGIVAALDEYGVGRSSSTSSKRCVPPVRPSCCEVCGRSGSAATRTREGTPTGTRPSRWRS